MSLNYALNLELHKYFNSEMVKVYDKPDATSRRRMHLFYAFARQPDFANHGMSLTALKRYFKSEGIATSNLDNDLRELQNELIFKLTNDGKIFPGDELLKAVGYLKQ